VAFNSKSKGSILRSSFKKTNDRFTIECFLLVQVYRYKTKRLLHNGLVLVVLALSVLPTVTFLSSR
jgi:hypothetical protein